MIQFDANGYQKVENESKTTSSKDLKENLCDDKENTISNHKQTRQHNNLSESAAMADCEKQSEMEDSGEDLNGNAQNVDYNSSNKTSIVDSREEREDDEIVDGTIDTEPSEINFNHKKSSLELEVASSQASQVSSAAILNEANAIFNNGMFQPGQMSMQTFQNAIAQFTANAIANNMDNETVMKNLAILQSALFTLQQQQFLQFQLIQHLQSQLVKKGSDGGGDDVGSCDKMNNKSDSDDEEMDTKSINKEHHHEIDEEDGEIDEEEMERQNEYHKRLMENKHFNNKMDTIIKDNENRLTRSKSMDNNDNDVGVDALKKAEEGLNAFTNNFVLSSNIITDHDPAVQISESTNSLAMLEKKAQEVLNSASQGILSNNLLDELAFANDKSSPNGRTDSSLFKHRCRYCGKIFGSDSSLQIHIRSHTGERPYKCNVCGSRFTTKGNLKVHFQRHSDKYPHIPMNPNPVPEHLDKYFPPLVPSEALKEMPNAPPPGALGTQALNLDNRQFPQRGFFPDFYLPRPPMDIFSSVTTTEVIRNPVDLSQLKKPESPNYQLSPEVTIHEEEIPKHTIKEEPEDETLDLSDKSSKTQLDHLETQQIINQPKISQPIRSSSPNIVQTSFIRQEREKIEDDSINNERALRSRLERDREHRERERERERERDEIEFNQRHKQNSVENLSKVPSVSPPSSSSSTSGSLYQDTVLDPSYFSAHLPRPDSNDSSWENYIEISSETSKLQELVDNIDNKNIEPNQCLVCKKVLSCRSALQMHYRVHTGERPFRCKICGRSFTTKGNLKTHMSVHRIKPPMRTLHQCPVCHQKFSNIFVLQQHIRLHTGEMTDLTPDQIRAAEIREFPDHGDMKLPPYGLRMPEFNPQKRNLEHSDDENDVDMIEENSERGMKSSRNSRSENKDFKSHHNNKIQKKSNSSHCEGIRVKTGLTSPEIENQVEDMRAMNLQRLSVHSASNDDFSRDSSPVSPSISEAKRLRSSTPVNHTPPLGNRSPIATPPADRPPFPYGHPFIGMPQFPPFINRPPFMNNVSMGPSAANMPPFGLFGVRGNTTTCNICFKTFACNSALDIHYRSHTKERPFKCTTCDRGFSTKGNMKQHMLTHKIRDMYGNSNSGDEAYMSSGGGHTSDSQSTNNNNQQINFNIKLEKSESPDFNDNDDDDDDEVDDDNRDNVDSNRKYDHKENNWCNKLNEMPENIAAS